MQRRTKKILGFPGMYRIEVFNPKTKRWAEPRRGNRFGVKFSTLSGKEQRKTFRSFADAKAFFAKVRSGDSDFITKQSKMTFGKLLMEWTRVALPHKQPSTQVRYRSYFKHFQFLEHLEVEQIQATTIDELITLWKAPEYLRQGQSTRCAYDHELSLLRTIFNFYVNRFNRNYKLPFIKDHKQMVQVRNKPRAQKDLNLAQVGDFFFHLQRDCLGTKAEPIFHLAKMQYAIFGRVQEAAALHVEDFDFANRIVRLTKRVVWLRAKAHEDYIESGLKASEQKEIRISDLAERTLREWTMRSGIRSGPLFFVDGKVIPYRKIEYRYSKALKAAGLPFRATHILRHASLTEVHATCGDILVTQRLAGHSNIKSTARYAKARDGRVEEAQKLMDERLKQHSL